MVNKHLESAVGYIGKAIEQLDKFEEDFLSKHKGSMVFYGQRMEEREYLIKIRKDIRKSYSKK